MQKNYTLNILLAAVVGLASLAALLCRVFLPAAILTVVSLPAVAALVLIALVLECYLTKPIPQRDWGVTGLLGALTFGLGMEALSDAEFLSQLVWSQGDLAVGENFDAITGATVTSRAVANAVNSASAFVTGADVSSGATEWGG